MTALGLPVKAMYYYREDSRLLCNVSFFCIGKLIYKMKVEMEMEMRDKMAAINSHMLRVWCGGQCSN